jgi:hypothetical protein
MRAFASTILQGFHFSPGRRRVLSENLPFCPYCRAENVAKIFYGLPLDDFSDNSEFEENLRSGRLVLGGCCVTPMTHRCNICKRDFAFPGNENEEEDEALVDALDVPHFCAAQSSEDYARAMEILERHKPRHNVEWADFFLPGPRRYYCCPCRVRPPVFPFWRVGQ